MALDAARTKAGVVRLKEHDADDVIADVSLPLQLLRVVSLVGQLRAHVEHDLYRPPARVNRVQACQVMHGVQPALVLVET